MAAVEFVNHGRHFRFDLDLPSLRLLHSSTPAQFVTSEKCFISKQRACSALLLAGSLSTGMPPRVPAKRHVSLLLPDRYPGRMGGFLHQAFFGT